MLTSRSIIRISIVLSIVYLDGCYTVLPQSDNKPYENKYGRLYSEAVATNSSLIEGIVSYRSRGYSGRGMYPGDYILENHMWLYNYPADVVAEVILSGSVDSIFLGKSVQVLGTYRIDYDANGESRFYFYNAKMEVQR